MTRSLVNNDRIQAIPGETGKFPTWEYYRNLFWEMRNLGNWGREARPYRQLRLAIRQYQGFRDKVQKFTTIEQVLHWINENPFEVYAAPLNVMIDTREPSHYNKVKIERVTTSDVNTKFRHDEYTEEDIEGDGWSFELHVYPDRGRFNIQCLLLGLAAYGIYAVEHIYETDSKGENIYRLTCYALSRDFEFSDADDPRWVYDPKMDDFKDEDLEDMLDEEGQRAKWFEDGLLDDEIEGLKGYFDEYH